MRLAGSWRMMPRGLAIARRAADVLLAAVLAPSCAVCNAVLDEPFSGCVCRACWQSIRQITPPTCDRCGDPLARVRQSPIRQSPSVCAPCSIRESALERARALGEYEGTLREIIHALKYSGRRSLARPLAALMRERARELLTGVDCVVPVPLHWRREYDRGFNQAREIARHLGLPVADVLVRRRATRAQIELAADRRKANVEGAFGTRDRFRRCSLAGCRMLLVDDVSTTGATLEACACVLKASGASEVHALTAARVVTWRRIGTAEAPFPVP